MITKYHNYNYRSKIASIRLATAQTATTQIEDAKRDSQDARKFQIRFRTQGLYRGLAKMVGADLGERP